MQSYLLSLSEIIILQFLLKRTVIVSQEKVEDNDVCRDEINIDICDTRDTFLISKHIFFPQIDDQ